MRERLEGVGGARRARRAHAPSEPRPSVRGWLVHHTMLFQFTYARKAFFTLTLSARRAESLAARRISAADLKHTQCGPKQPRSMHMRHPHSRDATQLQLQHSPWSSCSSASSWSCPSSSSWSPSHQSGFAAPVVPETTDSVLERQLVSKRSPCSSMSSRSASACSRAARLLSACDHRIRFDC